jgi:hypothetical protein
MAKGHDASDWTVEHDGDEGAVRCPEYRGRYRVRSTGVGPAACRQRQFLGGTPSAPI